MSSTDTGQKSSQMTPERDPFGELNRWDAFNESYLTSMVLMGIAALQVGVTNVRTVDGRIRLEMAAPRTSRRDAEERCNRHAAAENIIV